MSTKYATRAGRRLGTIDVPELDTLATDLDAAEARLATAEADIDALQAFDTTLQAAWTPYTPTIAAESGTFTSVAGTGKYKTVGKTTFIQIRIVITTNGTAATGVTATLPNTAANPSVLVGANTNVSGLILFGLVSGASMIIRTYANTYPGQTGEVLVLSGVYENT
jgi:hypothetical protein